MREQDIPMLTDSEVQAVTKLKKKIKETFSVKKLILFGSKARGDFNADSDVDLLVLVNEPKTRTLRNKLSNVQFEVISEVFDAPLMCVLENFDDWNDEERWIAIRDSVKREGIEIDL